VKAAPQRPCTDSVDRGTASRHFIISVITQPDRTRGLRSVGDPGREGRPAVSPPGAPVGIDPHQCASDAKGAYIGPSSFRLLGKRPEVSPLPAFCFMLGAVVDQLCTTESRRWKRGNHRAVTAWPVRCCIRIGG
jgi:hypothetical protein